LIECKDIITAGDGAKRNHVEGKAELSNRNGAIMKMLNKAGIPTAYQQKVVSIHGHAIVYLITTLIWIV